MGLHGKLVVAIEFRASGDVYHELFTYKPHLVPTVAPEIVQGCDLHEGEFGKVGSIKSWNYTHDGKQKFAKEKIQEVDEEKKKVVFKVFEGDLMKDHKDFVITLQVETNDGIDLVTWTLEYETLNDEVDAPVSFLNYFIQLTKAVEAHHLKA